MSKLESLLKEAFKRKVWKSVKNTNKCLSDETMTCLIENRISKNDEVIVNDHIVHCHSCAEKLSSYLVIARDLSREGEIQPPMFLLDRVKQLVSEKLSASDVLDIVLDIKERVLELIHTTGELLLGPTLVPALRGKDEAESKKSIHVVKNFDKFTAEVEIDKRVSNSTDLILRLTEKESNKRAEGIRVSLLKNEREIESQVLEGGKVKFEDIKPDSYKILIIKDEKAVGSVNIAMRLK